MRVFGIGNGDEGGLSIKSDVCQIIEFSLKRSQTTSKVNWATPLTILI